MHAWHIGCAWCIYLYALLWFLSPKNNTTHKAKIPSSYFQQIISLFRIKKIYPPPQKKNPLYTSNSQLEFNCLSQFFHKPWDIMQHICHVKSIWYMSNKWFCFFISLRLYILYCKFISKLYSVQFEKNWLLENTVWKLKVLQNSNKILMQKLKYFNMHCIRASSNTKWLIRKQ